MRSIPLPLLLVTACAVTEAPDPCAGPDATAACVVPTEPEDWYVAQAELYFDTMDKRVPLTAFPPYAEDAIRWEWPPWLKLTGFGRDGLEQGDRLLRAYPSVVDDRDCRFFPTQPFARCAVTFVYDQRPTQPCPIYEEFAFDDEGEVTFVEAWSSLPAFLPSFTDDPWGEDPSFARLSTRVPGLGAPGGELDLDSPAMAAAAASDPDVADLVTRARDFFGTWAAEHEAHGETMWDEGCPTLE